MHQHYIDEQTGEVFGYEKREGLTPCRKPEPNEIWDIVTHDWVDDVSTVEARRLTSISSEADALILSAYDELKQRKMMSYMLKLQSKLIGGGVLTIGEQTSYDAILSADAWITSIRIIENSCQADSNLPVDFSSVGPAPKL